MKRFSFHPNLNTTLIAIVIAIIIAPFRVHSIGCYVSVKNGTMMGLDVSDKHTRAQVLAHIYNEFVFAEQTQRLLVRAKRRVVAEEVLPHPGQLPAPLRLLLHPLGHSCGGRPSTEGARLAQAGHAAAATTGSHINAIAFLVTGHALQWI